MAVTDKKVIEFMEEKRYELIDFWEDYAHDNLEVQCYDRAISYLKDGVAPEDFNKALREIQNCIDVFYDSDHSDPVKEEGIMIAQGLKISLSILNKFCKKGSK